MATLFDRGVLGVATDPRIAGLTCEPFYGLREKPFSLTSDARFFYQSRSHAPAFDDLLNAIRRRESLTVLTGDIGTSKTTLCRAVLQSLDRPAPAVTPLPETSDPVDVWPNSIEDAAAGTAAASPRPQIRVRYTPRQDGGVAPAHVPRKWTRRLEFLAFGLVLLLVALMIGPAMRDAMPSVLQFVRQMCR